MSSSSSSSSNEEGEEAHGQSTVRHHEASDEESLLHDLDLDNLLGKEEEENESNNRSHHDRSDGTDHRAKKRKDRSSSASSSGGEESDAPKRPQKKKRRLKKKSSKQEESLLNLSASSSDDISIETVGVQSDIQNESPKRSTAPPVLESSDSESAPHPPKAPPKRTEKPLALAADDDDDPMEEEEEVENDNTKKTRELNIQTALFGNDEDDAALKEYLDELSNPHPTGDKPSSSSAGPKKRLSLNPDANNNNNPEEAAEMAEVVLTNEHIPVLGGNLDGGHVRCVYASNPVLENWSPLSYQRKTTTESLPVDENMLMTMPWGVYVLHSAQQQDGAPSARSRLKLVFDKERVTLKMGEAPWFVLLAPEETLRFMASPFFTYKVRVLRVDPETVAFTHRPEAPVFYVVGLDEKTPLWPADAAWAPIQLQRLMTDTLYAHIETESKRRGPQTEEKVKEVLSKISDFPMATSKPAEVLLPPSAVPLNNFSPRQERLDHIKSLLTQPFKLGAAAAAAVATASPSGQLALALTDATPFKKILSNTTAQLLAPPDYLFLDLEKAANQWQTLVIDLGLPVSVFSGLTHWSKHHSDEVLQRVNLLQEALAEIRREDAAAKDTEINYSLERILCKMRKLVELSPDWFDGWFRFVRSSTNRSERKRFYALFAACEVWRQLRLDNERYGAQSTYLFTKARREYLFESHLLWQDANYAHVLKLLKQHDTRASQPPLDEEEKTAIMLQIVDYVQTFNKEDGTSGPLFVIDRTAVLTDMTAIHKERYDTSRRLAKLIIQTALVWRQVRAKIAIPALRQLAPLIVQCATIYGSKSNNNTNDFYDDIKSAMGKDLVVMILRPCEDKGKMHSLLLKERDKYKNGQTPHMIIFDHFHAWSLETIATCVDKLEQWKLTARCTHLIFTGLANSLGFISGGGSMIWELLEVAERLDVLCTPTLHADSENQRVTKVLFDRNATRWKSSLAGVLSEQHYEHEMRSEQIEANLAAFLNTSPSAGKLDSVCKHIAKLLQNTASRKTVLVLYARLTTMRRIRSALDQINSALLSTIAADMIRFLSYRDIDQNPLALQQRDVIVLADMEYEGANRPTYLHLNAALEHARVGLLVIADTLRESAPIETFKDVFYRSDNKSDRYLLNIGRCPIVKKAFDELIDKPAIYNQLVLLTKSS